MQCKILYCIFIYFTYTVYHVTVLYLLVSVYFAVERKIRKKVSLFIGRLFPLFQLEEPWRGGARVPGAAGPHRLSQLLQVPRRQSDSHQQWWHDMVSYFVPSFLCISWRYSERSFFIARKCDCPGNFLVAKFQIITEFRKKCEFSEKINFFVWRFFFFLFSSEIALPPLNPTVKYCKFMQWNSCTYNHI